ncbi:MAG TPA: hypothetical protein VGZ90_13615 [Puia sp.]|jgi:hypothetical protein|nr:hypothetical protein [Puia sp.]
MTTDKLSPLEEAAREYLIKEMKRMYHRPGVNDPDSYAVSWDVIAKIMASWGKETIHLFEEWFDAKRLVTAKMERDKETNSTDIIYTDTDTFSKAFFCELTTEVHEYRECLMDLVKVAEVMADGKSLMAISRAKKLLDKYK